MVVFGSGLLVAEPCLHFLESEKKRSFRTRQGPPEPMAKDGKEMGRWVEPPRFRRMTADGSVTLASTVA